MTSSSIVRFAPVHRIEQEVKDIHTWISIAQHDSCIVSVVCEGERIVLVGLTVEKAGGLELTKDMLEAHFDGLMAHPHCGKAKCTLYVEANLSLIVVDTCREYLKRVFPALQTNWLCHVPSIPKQRGVMVSKQMREDAMFFMVTEVMHDKRFFVSERCNAQPAVVQLLLQLHANNYDGDSTATDLSLLLLMIQQMKQAESQ